MERILTDNIMNDKKICFIICYNDDKYISECLTLYKQIDCTRWIFIRCFNGKEC